MSGTECLTYNTRCAHASRWIRIEGVEKPRFQFTIMGILLATFWIAVFFGAATAAARAEKDIGFYAFPVAYALIVSPFLAAGALLGRAAALAGLVGLAVLVATLALTWLAFHFA
jgi:hypothetical protein